MSLEQFPGEAAKRTTAFAPSLTLAFHHEISPSPEGVHGVQAAEKRLLVGQDLLGLVRNHGPDEPLLVAEVVIQLRGAYAGRLLHVLPTRTRNAALVHQRRRRYHDALARGLPLGRERPLLVAAFSAAPRHA